MEKDINRMQYKTISPPAYCKIEAILTQTSGETEIYCQDDNK
jgi:hypothetical protein